MFDENILYDFHVGRYTTIGDRVRLIFDENYDCRCVSQGHIRGIDYQQWKSTLRKGHIFIMNDCRVCSGATIISGVTIGNGAVVAPEAVVMDDVPPYSIVAGNPAKVVGYRFNEKHIEQLHLIRWWNWPHDRIVANSEELLSDVNAFINKHIEAAKEDLINIAPVDISRIEKDNAREDDKVLLYIPDFEQEFPTYPSVISAFVEAYSDSNTELLLYVREDELIDKKIALLNDIFELYMDVNCYINLYVGNIVDERGLFGQVDGYITNRSKDNIYHMDLAELFGIPIISSVSRPMFVKNSKLQSMIKVVDDNKTSSDSNYKLLMHSIKTLADSQKHFTDTIEALSRNDLALDHTIDNLKYELYDELILHGTELKYPKIETIDETIAHILEGKSICRYGDAEFSIMQGENRQKFQRLDPLLQKRLIDVIKTNEDNIIIGIADMYGSLSRFNWDGKYNIRIYLSEETRQHQYQYIDFDRVYGNAFITRPYALYADNKTDAPQKRYAKLRTIWEGRKLLIIEGEKTRMGVGNDLFSNASDIIRILGPAESAFDRYDDILNEALKQDRERLVLLAMSATATVMAYDLSHAGFQALDVGHIDLEYEWMLAGEGKKLRIHDKYTNEVSGGDVVDDVQDEEYEKQIIARIY